MIEIKGVAVAGAKVKTRGYVDKVTGEQRTRGYTPAHVVKWQQYCRLVATEKMAGNPPLDGGGGNHQRMPLGMSLVIVLPVPKSFSGRKTGLALAGHLRPTTRPDCSNYLKAIEDALTGVVYYDDSSISELHVTRIYGETPMVRVEVWKVNIERTSKALPKSTQLSL